MKKQLIIASVSVVVIATTGVGSMALVSADASHTGSTKSAKVTRIDHHIRQEARLNQAVRDGTITASQKTALETELKTLKTERKAAFSKSSTAAERQAEGAQLKAELQAWTSSHNFPLAKVFPKLAA